MLATNQLSSYRAAQKALESWLDASERHSLQQETLSGKKALSSFLRLPFLLFVRKDSGFPRKMTQRNEENSIASLRRGRGDEGGRYEAVYRERRGREGEQRAVQTSPPL
jgi:hypothetical protein